MDAGHSTGLKVDFQEASEDAQKILNEASTVAEQKIKEKFPGLPAGIPTLGETTKTETKVS